MQIVVLANADLKEELLAGGQPSADIQWITDPQDFLRYPSADAFIDLLFEPSSERIALLRSCLPRPVLVSSVEKLDAENADRFMRFCGWPTLLRAPLVEAYAGPELRADAEAVLACFHKTVEWLPDEHGFVSARVISMIINEAHLALAEEVSSEADIDTAMKLGTNYPYGPFEWAQKIGRPAIYALLTRLGEEEPRYLPAAALK